MTQPADLRTPVFISWSGDLSRRLAEVIRHWLPQVMQMVRPYYTPADIEKGQRWGSDIAAQLEAAKLGIICLTPDNLSSEWIHFEAGALSKSLSSSRVCPILFNLNPSQVTFPLAMFQLTVFDKQHMKQLVETVNRAADALALEPDVLNEAFEARWPRLMEQVDHILQSQGDSEQPARRSNDEILDEILQQVRSLNSRQTIEVPYHASRMNQDSVVSLLSALTRFVPDEKGGTAAITVNGKTIAEIKNQDGKTHTKITPGDGITMSKLAWTTVPLTVSKE